MRLLAAGLVLVLATPLARADALVATHSTDTLFIHRAAPDRLDKLFEEKGRGAYAYAWIDATLWVLRKDKSGVTLGKVVDGKADPATRPVTVPAATPGKDIPEGIDLAPGLAVTKSGQLYVTSCIGEEPVPGAPMQVRCKFAYHRADDGSFTAVARRPRDVVYQSGEARAPRLAVLRRPPKGYGVAITRVKLKGEKYTGFVCTSPAGKKGWPTAADELMESVLTPKVNKATWIATTPPVVHIEANGKSPMGEKLHQDWWLLDCTTEIDAVRPLRDGLWMAGDEVRSAKGALIGTLPGGEPVVAP